ncbi:cation efflux family-domain-containing protein [Phycomyces blakesleeanus]|uniref:Uncharacterized protein n=2 Tax=Phycomyces blakesleeanus TaxID=4837 RepID=A0A162U489_PHYB8|nr:hypothetical protein PHYBLDRAFT_80015 [Phycomyces blakesleeanus NRRL 1555(-)]OAD72223.1 hypothetical protein PHYBLDRAFT_80015 [Phycomyces blakesleeanus NRRL 1555(-)]|eukprot:XP_018290263.1 hypothetical protein PHYBLDRAFT_80015 [Phycomyces blakesleeanus NRRL 1555(-)]
MESTRFVVLRGSEACYSIVRQRTKAGLWSSVRSLHNIRQASLSNRETHFILTNNESLRRTRTPRYTLYKRELRLHGTHNHSHGGAHDHVHVDLGTTIRNSGKQGVRITVIGMAANVGLTVSKGLAGWMMNSASLLADAAHSFSDLLSDFVTLYTFKMSRKEPDAIYPYGYGKYETVGTLAVSSLLIAGAFGIGIHSFELLMAALNVSGVDLVTQGASVAATATAEANSGTDILSNTTTANANVNTSTNTSSSLSHGHSHGHFYSNDGVLDPNAAWFALASVITKEWLYRATIKVGEKERSDVLVANAWHHRSDAYSSVVALVAIGGSWAGLPVLDPLGGLLVAGMIFQSGGSLMRSSLRELTDKGIGPAEITDILSAINKVKEQEQDLIDFHSIRGRKMGPFHHLDLVLQLNPQLTISQAHRIEQLVRHTIKTECKLIQEVLVHLDAEKQPPHH